MGVLLAWVIAMAELKNCPFCGGPPVYITRHNYGWVECEVCGARTRGAYFDDYRKIARAKYEEAVWELIERSWNRRNLDEELQALGLDPPQFK